MIKINEMSNPLEREIQKIIKRYGFEDVSTLEYPDTYKKELHVKGRVPVRPTMYLISFVIQIDIDRGYLLLEAYYSIIIKKTVDEFMDNFVKKHNINPKHALSGDPFTYYTISIHSMFINLQAVKVSDKIIQDFIRQVNNFERGLVKKPKGAIKL